MKRRKQPNRLKLFYYSHPYFVIFNVLIIYNLILIALAALVMTYLMNGITRDGILILAKLEHPWNAQTLIDVTLDGMLIFVKLVQSWNV